MASWLPSFISAAQDYVPMSRRGWQGAMGMDSKIQRQIVRNNISLVVMVLTLVALLAVGAAFWLIL